MESLLKAAIATFLREKQATWLREQRRFSSRMLSLPRVAALAAPPAAGATPHDVVFEQGTLRLLRYRRATPATRRHPLLFC